MLNGDKFFTDFIPVIHRINTKQLIKLINKQLNEKQNSAEMHFTSLTKKPFKLTLNRNKASPFVMS